jgi:hypothetical protein
MRCDPLNDYRPWTQDEVRTLKRLLEEGAPPRAMAKKLNRTLEALHYMMRVEKLSGHVRPMS